MGNNKTTKMRGVIFLTNNHEIKNLIKEVLYEESLIDPVRLNNYDKAVIKYALTLLESKAGKTLKVKGIDVDIDNVADKITLDHKFL